MFSIILYYFYIKYFSKQKFVTYINKIIFNVIKDSSNQIFCNLDCDKSKCPGPIKFYEEIKCKPIFEITDDCCASAYDCSHLGERVQGKCYVGDKIYNPGDVLDKGIAPRCKLGCICSIDKENK